ncbi:MAG TPA: methyltransferase domain-containing protein [Pyrinomonadaceae bacterium]|nr:methyltransferase domain-containing protein [Pyrinomonadaceae bacterium]
MEEQENLWGYQKRLRFVRSVIEDNFPGRHPSKITVLDIGCGNGSQLALPLARSGYQVTGIDPDEKSIAHAALLSKGIQGLRFLRTSVSEVAEKFDVVILSEVLEHVDDPGGLLKAGVRVLNPKGLVIVTTPNGYGEFEMDSWVFGLLRMQRLVDKLASNRSKVLGSTENSDSGHIQFFTRKRLYRIFRECGLTVWREGAASLFAGPFAGHLLARSDRFIQWNAVVTDRLPTAVASGWYFALRREDSSGVAE